MAKHYWTILITYIVMQLSGLLGVPLLQKLNVADPVVIWSVFSFLTALIIMLVLLRSTPDVPFERSTRVSGGQAVGWSILGVFMAYASQIVAAMIEMNVFGIDPGSENTEMLIEVAKASPIFIIVTSIIGPILEEIVFRKVIFGSLYKRFNFWIAGILSSVIFAAIHFDFSHILIYTAMGLTFAFLYVKTKRLIVPIIAHMTMNTFVVLINVYFADDIMEMEKQLNQTQSFIGGLFS
ncbi:CPBP family intramembrane glutamic endopeptidase [Bacillus sp. RAR_GA_16]|uniref:CPBP family intramembrane glutamic endopeptidase n=1 Tax=Bacillus sp. RAR_GA_16 TaxID=2876774 RepID=UPI001CCCAA9F|nr:type II CAAX endopeptidase family protein [Bacillus sp. RAR_GA_16]MCA0173733.1 CPBP family intramembrane metalloprotease [Bacillus sp. RAR_GA_16]